MCGLVGFSGKNNVDANKMKILMLLARNRGDQSAGYGYYKKDKGVEYRCVHKDAIDPRHFVSSVETPKVDTIIGHTRNPSLGTLRKKEHAHPFDFEKIIGAHNGRIGNWNSIASRLNLNYDVDSEVFFHLLVKEYDLDFSKALGDVYGEMAFSWINVERELYLYRYKRPLYIGRDENEDMYYASESDYLKVIGCSQILELDENVLYVYKNGSLIRKEGDLPKPDYRHTKSNYESSYKSYKDEIDDFSKSYNLNIAIRSEYAPSEHKTFVGIDGRIIYSWATKTTINIETVGVYSITNFKSYDLKSKSELIKLSTHYPEIYKYYVTENKIK